MSEVHSKVTRVVSSTTHPIKTTCYLCFQLLVSTFSSNRRRPFWKVATKQILGRQSRLRSAPSLIILPSLLFILSTILIMIIKNCSFFANRPLVVLVIDKGLFCPQNCFHTLIFKHQDGQIMRWLLNTWHYKTVVLEYGCCSIFQQSFTPICTVSSCFQWPHRLTATCE